MIREPNPQHYLTVLDLDAPKLGAGILYCNVCGQTESNRECLKGDYIQIEYSANGAQSHIVTMCRECAKKMANGIRDTLGLNG